MKNSVFVFLNILFVCLTYSSSASARNWGSVGGWEVFGIESDACGITMEYEGKGATEFTIIQDVNDKVMIIVTNGDWTSKEDQEYLVGYIIDQESYIPPYKTRGVTIEYRKGFSSVFETDILRPLAAGRSIDIYLNRNPDDENSKFQLIDELKLTGSASGLSRMRQCLTNAKKIQAAKKAEEEKFSHLPDDPFSSANNDATPRVGNAKKVGHRISKSYGIRYPTASMKAGFEGTVHVELKVGKLGNVLKCRIVQSSGFDLLDQETCKALNRPRRYTPALDTMGNPIEGKITEKIVWQLPEPELPPEPLPEMEIELAK